MPARAPSSDELLIASPASGRALADPPGLGDTSKRKALLDALIHAVSMPEPTQRGDCPCDAVPCCECLHKPCQTPGCSGVTCARPACRVSPEASHGGPLAAAPAQSPLEKGIAVAIKQLTAHDAAASGVDQQPSSVQLTPIVIDDAVCLHPLAPLITLLDAFLFGIVAWLCGFKTLGDNLVVVYEHVARSLRGDAYRAASFYTLERTTEGVDYDGRRHTYAAVRRRLLSIAGFLFILVLAAWVDWTLSQVRLPPIPNYNVLRNGILQFILRDAVQPSSSVFRSMALWAGQWFDYMSHASAKDALSYWGVVSFCMFSIAFGAALLQLAPRTRLLNLPAGGLTAVLPLFLKPQDPLAMVSYGWSDERPANVVMARSIAHALPDCWIDVRWLAPGVVVAKETILAARSSYCLVVMLSAYFLTRPACLLELVAALHTRDCREQHTLFLCLEPNLLGDKKDEIMALFSSNGMQLFDDASKLLAYLSAHVYASTTPDDTSRLLSWYGNHASPLRVLNRSLIMPSPFVAPPASASFNTRLQSVLAMLPTFAMPAAPMHALVAGTNFLSSDALTTGRCSAYSIEHLFTSVAIVLGFIAASVLFINVDMWTTDGVTVWLPFLVIAVVLISFFAPLLVFFDPRVRHSAELLPINAAAACNFALSVGSAELQQPTEQPSSPIEAQPPAEMSASIFSLGIYFSSPCEEGDQLHLRLNNVASFLGETTCGMPVTFGYDAFGDALNKKLHSCEDAHIAIVIIRSQKGAHAWGGGGPASTNAHTLVVRDLTQHPPLPSFSHPYRRGRLAEQRQRELARVADGPRGDGAVWLPAVFRLQELKRRCARPPQPARLHHCAGGRPGAPVALLAVAWRASGTLPAGIARLVSEGGAGAPCVQRLCQPARGRHRRQGRPCIH